MNKCTCTSKKHGHGPKPCGAPTTGEFCDDCSSRMVTDKISGEEALNRQVAETSRPRRGRVRRKRGRTR
jgi:hypothetical protein